MKNKFTTAFGIAAGIAALVAPLLRPGSAGQTIAQGIAGLSTIGLGACAKDWNVTGTGSIADPHVSANDQLAVIDASAKSNALR